MTTERRMLPLTDAAFSLMCLWVDDETYPLRCRLSSLLTHEVGQFNLLAEYGDFERRRDLLSHDKDYDEERAKRMVTAWLSSPGSVQ
jgi:hypothetical protein